MHNLENFYNKTLKYELINKFEYTSSKSLPTIKKIILNFGCKTADLKQLSSSLLALELVTNQPGTFTITKRSNILFKIRKGNPTGCKVTLRKFQMFNFLSKISIEIVPRLKNFNGFNLAKKSGDETFSYKLKETFCFSELENHYYLFNNLPELDITVVTNSNNKKELKYLLTSFQWPFK